MYKIITIILLFLKGYINQYFQSLQCKRWWIGIVLFPLPIITRDLKGGLENSPVDCFPAPGFRAQAVLRSSENKQNDADGRNQVPPSAPKVRASPSGNALCF